ncbi:hypothetical protein [Actinokineospora enzanensis]|uniref:hypothetical protein n=1 Tax=Actinokineospora enzanensis TaxID=155975 RepID=UPI0003A7DB0D|nr:hypothetical protein [Actinokineospora enzanensis]
MFSGPESWSIGVKPSDQGFDWALWFRAAERIDVDVVGETDLTPLPDPSTPRPADLTDGWLRWWETLVAHRTRTDPTFADISRFAPPDFAGLADHPALQAVVAARWPEADTWHSRRKRAAMSRPHGREGDIVRAVEAEIGHEAAPFAIRITVLPIVEDRVRRVGSSLYLVPEQIYATSTYDTWLHGLVRALA